MITLNTTRVLSFFVWAPILFFSGLIVWNSLDFYTLNQTSGFLAEKTEALQNPIWTASFIIHITFGIPCLILPIAQFSKRVLVNNPQIHISLGKAYAYTSLFIVAPTGMYMSFWAKEGFWAGLGFFFTGVALSVTTLRGLQTFRNGNIQGHVEWMTRSYAVATSAITFRLIHFFFHEINLVYHFNYVLSVWLSLFINLLLAEISIIFLIRKFFNSKNNSL
jgi:hypothetical protein